MVESERDVPGQLICSNLWVETYITVPWTGMVWRLGVLSLRGRRLTTATVRTTRHLQHCKT